MSPAMHTFLTLMVLVFGYCIGVWHATPAVWGEIELETACKAISEVQDD